MQHSTLEACIYFRMNSWTQFSIRNYFISPTIHTSENRHVHMLLLAIDLATYQDYRYMLNFKDLVVINTTQNTLVKLEFSNSISITLTTMACLSHKPRLKTLGSRGSHL